MCISSGDKAQKQAAAQQQQTTADEQAAVTGISSIFTDPSRQAEYDKLGADTTAYYTNDVNQQEAIAARQQKFALARQGQTGGSQQAYEGGQLSQDYQKAIVQATNQGQTAEANLKSSDEQQRESLVTMAMNGLSANEGESQATGSLATSLQAAQGGIGAQSMGNLFGDLSQYQTDSTNAAALRQGLTQGYGSIFAPIAPTASTSGSGYDYASY